MSDPSDQTDQSDQTVPSGPTGADVWQERADHKVAWLELFFDLIVIAGIALLSAALHEEPTLAGLGMFVLIYAAVWMTWISVVLYTDIARTATRTRTVLVAMFLVAVMFAASPTEFPERANAIAIAFLLCRFMIGRGSLLTGRILAAWPLLQFGGFSIPWIASLWVPAPWKYWLWALAIVVDLGIVLLAGEKSATNRIEQVRAIEERSDNTRSGRGRRGFTSRSMQVVSTDAEHLEERLGVFVIIVFGEAVAAMVIAASGQPWTRDLVVVVLAGFVALVAQWSLTFSYGYAAAPHTRFTELPLRFGLPMHLLNTIGVLLFAAGLGAMASHPEHHLDPVMRWATCGGLALTFAIGLISGITGQAPKPWIWWCAVPCVLMPLLLAGFTGHLHVGAFAWLLVVPGAWAVFHANRSAVLERLGITAQTPAEEARRIGEEFQRAERERRRRRRDRSGNA